MSDPYDRDIKTRVAKATLASQAPNVRTVKQKNSSIEEAGEKL